MTKKVLASWSSGKDSAWMLHKMLSDSSIHVAGIFTTVNKKFERVAMHAVRNRLLLQQAAHINQPLTLIELPFPCSNEAYDMIMKDFIATCKKTQIEAIAFGDLFLEDIRTYREKQMLDTGIMPIFPLWKLDTLKLAGEMIETGVKAIITCVDPEKLQKDFVGRVYDQSFINDLPEGVDPCGENGEFHTFVYDGPIFDKPVRFTHGAIIERDGFIYQDLKPIQ